MKILLLLLSLALPVCADPEPIIPPKINLALASLKVGMAQDDLIKNIRRHYPDAYIMESVGGLANRGLCIRLHKGEKIRYELGMSVTNGKSGWELKSEKFTLRDSKLKRWIIIRTEPIEFVKPTLKP